MKILSVSTATNHLSVALNDGQQIIVEKNYEAAFQEGLNKIHEYPTCDMLIYTTIIYLEGALTLYSVPNPE